MHGCRSFRTLVAALPLLVLTVPSLAANGPDRTEVWNRLKRNGILTYSQADVDDAARSAPGDTLLGSSGAGKSSQLLRQVLMRSSIAGDATRLKSMRVYQYDKDWNIINRAKDGTPGVPVPRYAALPDSNAGGDQQVAEQQLLVDYMGSYLQFLNLDRNQTEATYKAQRQDYFDFIKAHLKHRYATGLLGPLLHPAAEGGAPIGVNDLFASRATGDDIDFVKPDRTRIVPDGAGFRFPSGKTYTYRNWNIEFLFQKKSTWPAMDTAVIEKAGSLSTARRQKNGPSDWGWWLSPAVYQSANPAQVADSSATFTDNDWQQLKTSGYYEPGDHQPVQNRVLNLLDPDQYSVVWGPGGTDTIADQKDGSQNLNDYYFDPGHNRGVSNDLWFQYQCQVLVKAQGQIEVSGAGATVNTSYTCGPYYFSDLLYVEMYATEKTVPNTLAGARELYGQTSLFAYSPPLDTTGKARQVDAPDVSVYLFDTPGTPDGKASPKAFYPSRTLNLAAGLPENFAEDANVFYKTGSDAQSLIRFPPADKRAALNAVTQVPHTPAEFKAFLDTYYTNFAIYYPAVTGSDGKQRGPWLVKLGDVSGDVIVAPPHPYRPHGAVPGADSSVTWKDLVYKPTRFPAGRLQDAIDYLFANETGTVKANYGTPAAPADYPHALNGELLKAHPVFEVPTKQTNYQLLDAALPVPVSYQTVTGAFKDGANVEHTVTAGADVQLANTPGFTMPKLDDSNDATVQNFLPNVRDNYAFAAVTTSAGCCGTVVQKVVDKRVAVAFQPRPDIVVTLTDSQAKTGTGAGASVESLGVWHDSSLSTGVSSLPYDPMSVASRMPANYPFADQNNYASLRYDAPPADAPGIFSDANNRSSLETQLTYYAGQSYDLRFSAQPATGPTVVSQDPAGNPSAPYVYYCAKAFTAKIERQDGAAWVLVSQYNLMSPPLASGPYAGLSTEPPSGSVTVVWPQEGIYRITTVFTDGNDVTREVVSKVVVSKKGFAPQQTGEERERK